MLSGAQLVLSCSAVFSRVQPCSAGARCSASQPSAGARPSVCSVFKGEVTRIILYCYKNRITPTVKMLQSKLRECQRFSEEQISAILQVCARDAPMLYHIQPPMRGEQPVIVLAKSPIWFQGFVNQEEEQQPQNTNDDAVDKGFQDPEVVKVFQQMLQDENLLLPRQVSEAASKLQQKVQPFWHVSTLELELMLRDAMSKKLLKSWADGMRPVIHRKNAKPMPIGPLAPGACNANNIGLVRAEASINGSQAESELSTENDKDNEARKDVTDLLTELVLAFPSGLRFSTLKEHLRTCNDGLFSETSFTCPAAKNWTEKVNGLSSMFAGPVAYSCSRSTVIGVRLRMWKDSQVSPCWKACSLLRLVFFVGQELSGRAGLFSTESTKSRRTTLLVSCCVPAVWRVALLSLANLRAVVGHDRSRLLTFAAWY
ncbi:unnamed protein product [Effrenium voratum]|uniref:Uncharacterized protein n=1 Tax=Effrenium voratum TaxID=2562239 RepID=A0AA36IQ26_9DINO|nr:unnamed protein product [Effrenium voratum]